MGLMATRSPARHPVTPFPVSATVPTASWPITVPPGIMIPFRYPWTSEPQLPHRPPSTPTPPGSPERSWNLLYESPWSLLARIDSRVGFEVVLGRQLGRDSPVDPHHDSRD